MGGLSLALLELLRCPVNHAPLALLDEDALIALNARILAGEVSDSGGQLVTQTVEGALARDDGQLAYPLRAGVVDMQPARALVLR